MTTGQVVLAVVVVLLVGMLTVPILGRITTPPAWLRSRPFLLDVTAGLLVLVGPLVAVVLMVVGLGRAVAWLGTRPLPSRPRRHLSPVHTERRTA